MSRRKRPTDQVLAALQERAKELNCLYEVEELLNNPDLSLEQLLQAVAKVIPPGWQYPDICRAELIYQEQSYRSEGFRPTSWFLKADIVVQGEVEGVLTVYYTKWMPNEHQGPFLKEEVKLVRTIAERLAHHITYQQYKRARQEWEKANGDLARKRAEWHGPVRLLRQTDKGLYVRIARKLLNHLFWGGVHEAATWVRQGSSSVPEMNFEAGEVNAPGRVDDIDESWLLTEEPFERAARFLSDSEIVSCVQRWMLEDRASYFTTVLRHEKSSLPEIADALRRYHHVVDDVSLLPAHTVTGLRVSLIQKLLTEQSEFVMVAKEYISTQTFERILDRVIMTTDSFGKLGGKAAGLILAHRILRETKELEDDGQVKVPMSWFVASNTMRQFITYNDLQEVFEQKYKSIDEVRHDYSNIVKLFKSSRFPPDLVKGVSVMLDEFADTPLVVRSSSLLEDRVGAAFSGKYKSLFLANLGSKAERLEAMLDAIAEVFASTFGPDPIEYRREHGLLDFSEEMGVLIQQVVGRRVGKYFMPAFAGVAFSNNEFRWSPRIRREDGLIRLVVGLGSRAVDRVADDYPVLVVPGKPNLRVNASTDEVVRYAPKRADVIDLEVGRFTTVDISELLDECGTELPAFEQTFSVLENDLLRKPVPILTDPQKDELAVTFNGLLTATPFVSQMERIMSTLQAKFSRPVDIEFAHDGKHIYLLQCRVQNSTDESSAAPIPRDAPDGDVLFTATHHVSNGWVPDLSYVVYVDPGRYGELRSREEMLDVGHAVGMLNKLLPRRRFALLGPGRWGSRGDIKLGVSVTYADINNTALLCEMAYQRGSYVPDLSFGTHFFQDLVEASIRYLPLYPDEEGVRFREVFFQRSKSLLAKLLPELAYLDGVVRVINIPASTNGRLLRVLMNADLDEAMGLLVSPDDAPNTQVQQPVATAYQRQKDEFWQWRLRMAERLAAELDGDRFGVVGLYVFGSTKNATAGPASDIDLLVHFSGTPEQKLELDRWLEGWSLSLGEMNFLKTGYRTGGILDVHFVTDADIERRTSWAVKIGAVTDAARPLPMKEILKSP